MRRCLLLGVGILIGLAGSATQAHAQLNQRDRLLLYYNYYQNQQQSREILQNQQQIRQRVIEFGQLQNQRRLEVDPLERYVRGSSREQMRERQLPRIYSGGGGYGSQYFMRMNQFGTHYPMTMR